MENNNDYEMSTGNVFADLGLPNPEELLAKVQLTLQISQLIEEKKLTHAAAKVLGLSQSEVSALRCGKRLCFSLEYLSELLNVLNQHSK